MDFLRIAACFWVVFNHQPGYLAYQSSTHALSTFGYMFFTMVTRINVPIFFMLTGALLLPKETTYKELFSERILRMASVLVIFSFTFYIVTNKSNLGGISLLDFLRKLIAGDHQSAYWYLYAYLGFLLTLPFMQRIAHRFTREDFLLIIAVHCIISTVLPIANHIIHYYSAFSTIQYSDDFRVPLMTTKAFFYPLIGYYLEHVFDIDRLRKKHLFCLLALSCLGIGVSSLLTYQQGIASSFTQNYVQVFDYVLAINFYITVKYFFTNCHKLNNLEFISFISSLTFGIYLMDPILRRCGKHIFFDAIIPKSYPLFYSFSWCLFSMTVGGFITYLLKKLPWFNKLL